MKLVTTLENNLLTRKIVIKNSEEACGDSILQIANDYLSVPTSSVFVGFVIFTFFVSFFLGVPSAIICFIGEMGLCFFYHFFVAISHIKINYRMDDAIRYEYSAFVKIFASLTDVNTLWIGKLISKRVRQATIERIKAYFSYSTPGFLKIDSLQVPSIGNNEYRFFFLPDKIVYSKNGQFYEYLYSDLSVFGSQIRFTEEGSFPQDARIVGVDWEHKNKNGMPDKRYKNNKEYSVCLYDRLIFNVAEEQIIFLLSKSGIANGIVAGFQEYTKVISKYRTGEFKIGPKSKFSNDELAKIISGALLMIEIDGHTDKREVEVLGNFLEKHYDQTSILTMGEYLDLQINAYKSRSGYFKEKIDSIFSDVNFSSEQKKIILNFYEEIMLSDNVSAEAETYAMSHFRKVL